VNTNVVADTLVQDPLVLLAPHLAAVEAVVRSQVSAFEPEVQEMAAYCLEQGGKRLRPALVLAAGWTGAPVPDAHLVRAGAVLEMVHLATLVHDDIMDRADERRRRPTAARRWGPAAAVLLGDTLFAQAVVLSTQFPDATVCREVAGAARRVCSGEILQTLRREGDPATYWRVLELKTAELFRVSCIVGARLGGYPEAFAQAAGRFGNGLGVAFQVYDDLLDCISTSEQAGKTLGTDLDTGKLTLPLQFLAQRDGRGSLRAYATGGDVTERLERLRARLHATGVVDAVVAEILGRLDDACAELRPHASEPAARLLLSLSQVLRHLVTALPSAPEAAHAGSARLASAAA
jgi:octaprenyl-diphosphate synthase